MTARANTDSLKMAAATDRGTVRKHNEDFFLFSQEHGFFIVCDGMGGHSGGAFASRIAGETMRDVLSNPDFLDLHKCCADLDEALPLPAQRLIAGARLANRRIFMRASQHRELRGMGSTLVAAVVHEGWLFSINIGDSRIYRLREGELEPLTRDHSWINELLEDDEISEEEVQAFSKKNVLTRALGIYPTVKIDVRIENVHKGDFYLLCSDGLHNALEGELIQSVISADYHSLQALIDKLVLSAKQMNGSDNITGGAIAVNTIPGEELAQTLFEKTVVEAPDKVNLYLDRFIRQKYGDSGKGMMWKRQFSIAAMLLVLVISATVWFVKGGSESGTNGQTMRAGPAGASDTPQPANAGAVRDETGRTLVLLQVAQSGTIDLLRHFEGVRVVHTVENFSQGNPARGPFSLVITDSTNQVVHEHDGLRLAPDGASVPAPATTRNGTTPVSPGTESEPANGSDLSLQNKGLIYLVSSLESEIASLAEIYVDNTRIGSFSEYSETGLYLAPGTYTLSIRDATGNRLKTKSDVSVIKGEIIVVEF